jgi:S-adenosylmethionine:tRNA ribosyltransferase-isomerase
MGLEKVKVSDFDFELPPGLIAQRPLPERTDSRMMVIDRRAGTISHEHVRDLPGHLAAGDLLVTNNTRVLHARLFGSWSDTGGKVEILLVEDLSGNCWRVMSRSARRVREGQCMQLCDGQLEGKVLSADQGGQIVVQFSAERPLMEIVEAFGVPPVPPYIRRKGNEHDSCVEMDRERYQTVYAREPGAIAAPTAGLHFSDELLEEIERRGVARAEITLHVGPGTFRPVKCEVVAEHQMDVERYGIGEMAAQALETARQGAGKLMAVGTTTVRTLESVVLERGRFEATVGETALFVYPPHTFETVDVLLTNFHLPRSTLLMLVTAFITHGIGMSAADVANGLDLMRSAYREAVNDEYRFYSYGDCMLIV